jgi:hypothetical protein
MFAVLAVATLVLVSLAAVVVWARRRRQRREIAERFAVLNVLLQNPGEPGARVMTAWREQESLARARGRRLQLRRGFLAVAGSLVLAAMLRVLSPASAAWTIGIVPGLVGCAILAFASSIDRPA